MASQGKTSTHERYNELGAKLNKLKEDLVREEAKLVTFKQQHKANSTDNKPAEKTPEHRQCETTIKKAKEEIDKVTKEWRRADPDKLQIDRAKFEEHLTRRFFVIPSFEIYGGVGGLYDFGPMACAIKANVIALWRRHFVLEENMLELDLTCLTPEPVFKASGHVQRFADWMVKDEKSNTCYRADKLLGEFIEGELDKPNNTKERIDDLKKIQGEIDGYSGPQLGAAIKQLQVVAPDTKNSLSDPYPFNLMFSTQIGPTGKFTGYLRPETAQGIFVNFRRLLDFNSGQVPFAAATIGQAFRNEIAPRSGLLRVREFTLAEIEHFMNPAHAKNDHPKLHKIKHLMIPLLSRERQSQGLAPQEQTLESALEQGILFNRTLAYFIGRTYLFMRQVGILGNGIRFRQHMRNEMAHYASDCWDCELLTSYGWIECVGLADRSCYDLAAHSHDSGVDLVAYETFKEPQIEQVVQLSVIDKAKFKQYLKKHIDPVMSKLNSLAQHEMLALQQELQSKGSIQITLQDGNSFDLTNQMIKFEQVTKKITGKHFTPAVIEPAFGIGRIIYCLLEHCYWVRQDAPNTTTEDDASAATTTTTTTSSSSSSSKKKSQSEDKTIERTVFSFPPQIAPYKTAVLPLQQDSQFEPFVQSLSELLTNVGVSHKVDVTGTTIGKRYARIDDVGVPFAITIDYTSLKDNTVTLRERDSCTQVRAPVDQVVQLISKLIDAKLSWKQVQEQFPEQAQTASKSVGKKQ